MSKTLLCGNQKLSVINIQSWHLCIHFYYLDRWLEKNFMKSLNSSMLKWDIKDKGQYTNNMLLIRGVDV